MLHVGYNNIQRSHCVSVYRKNILQLNKDKTQCLAHSLTDLFNASILCIRGDGALMTNMMK